ncbi:tol-pal system-associated acyl-CoA thioesterase [Solimicrobium silvestre]|uniref:tol-pal system-associated acyl-CoA thioesterase n=1 Tax=Solimicrobium silvestre TaxID=2099400 RepID=UPI001FB048CF|nr:tol-pal system-associated acyl-CoA thioesterase [Solimicrobium silvestre]
MIQDSNFCWPLRIYYEDTDAGGIVYYANYLKYFERARTEWLRQLGVNQQELADQQQAMFVVKSSLVDYHLPARLDDELQLITVVEKLGRASLVFVQEAWRGTQCLVSGRFKVGCVDTQTIRPCAIPPAVLQALQASHFPSLD